MATEGQTISASDWSEIQQSNRVYVVFSAERGQHGVVH